MNRIMILIAEGLEECEALVPYDLFLRAGLEVDLVSITNDLNVASTHNFVINTHKLIKDINPGDYALLMLPGGMPGVSNLEASKDVQDLIDSFVKEDKYIAAICAAPSILVHKGLVKDNEFVCFPGFEENLKQRNEKAYTHNKFITGKGLGASFEFAHEIISLLVSKEKADEVISRIQY